MEDDELIKGGDRFAMQIYEDIYNREGTVELHVSVQQKYKFAK